MLSEYLQPCAALVIGDTKPSDRQSFDYQALVDPEGLGSNFLGEDVNLLIDYKIDM